MAAPDQTPARSAEIDAVLAALPQSARAAIEERLAIPASGRS